eukprot:scaffold83789_cov63-Phaeocystis_antarctica.AAC.4
MAAWPSLPPCSLCHGSAPQVPTRFPRRSQRVPARPRRPASAAQKPQGVTQGAPCSPSQRSEQPGAAWLRTDSGASRIQPTGTSVACPRSRCSQTSPEREARPTASSTSRRWGGGRVSATCGAATCGQSPACGAARR